LSVLAGVDLRIFEPAWPALGDLWFTLAEIAARGGRPSVLFSPCDPPELERMRANHAVGEVRFILLDCDDDEISARLGERKDWSSYSTVEALSDAARMRAYPYETIRTDEISAVGAAERIVGWVRKQMNDMAGEAKREDTSAL
jgi:hypothetical protein